MRGKLQRFARILRDALLSRFALTGGLIVLLIFTYEIARQAGVSG